MTEATNIAVETEAPDAVELPPAARVPTTRGTKAAKAAKAATVDEEIAAVAFAPAPAPKTRRIILEENDKIPPTGLFIGINGKSYMIRPGEEVDVPLEVIGVLDDAVEDVPRVDSNKNVVDYRHKMRFPYRIIM